jgi:hypothetical protein
MSSLKNWLLFLLISVSYIGKSQQAVSATIIQIQLLETFLCINFYPLAIKLNFWGRKMVYASRKISTNTAEIRTVAEKARRDPANRGEKDGLVW